MEYTGLYRCRVVDTVTGEYSYSSAAYVYWPITCNYARPWKSSNSFMYFYRASFLGGVGPYTVYTYQVVTDPTCRLQGEWFLFDGDKGVQTINTMSELYSLTIHMFKYLEILEDQEANPQVYKKYVVGVALRVVDALGNVCESPVMEWK